jgi:hypothetical protein
MDEYRIINILTDSIENYLSEKIGSGLNSSNNSINIKCCFLGPESIIVNSILKIDYHLSRMFIATFSKIQFCGRSENIIEFNTSITEDEKDLDTKIFNLFLNEISNKNFEINKNIISYFENYFNAFRTYVEENINLIIIENVIKSEISNPDEINVIEQKFSKPDFLIKKINEGEVNYIYKRGEGYQERVFGKEFYEFEKINNSFCQDREKSIKIFLEEKARRYRYSENGHHFNQSSNNDYKFRDEQLDIDMTRILINHNNFESRDDEYDNFLTNKHKKLNERLNKTLNRRELYFILYILFCDMGNFFKAIKPQEKSENYHINMYKYYLTLYDILFLLTNKNRNSPLIFDGPYIFKKHFDKYCNNNSINELPQFEYIIDSVKNKFKNIPVDECFDNFSINSYDYEYNYDNLVSTLYTFFGNKLNN